MSGRFKKHDGGEITYDGGSVELLSSPVEELFSRMMSVLSLSTYRQRVWFKLPYEDLKDVKILCDGSVNYAKMCEAANWTRMVDIYMDADENDSPPEKNNEGEETDFAENDDIHHEFEEEARVEKTVAGFEDDDENDDYQRTPPASDNEEEDTSENKYERWKKGSGVLTFKD